MVWIFNGERPSEWLLIASLFAHRCLSTGGLLSNQLGVFIENQLTKRGGFFFCFLLITEWKVVFVVFNGRDEFFLSFYFIDERIILSINHVTVDFDKKNLFFCQTIRMHENTDVLNFQKQEN